MARRKIPKGQINRKNKQTVQALVNLMEDLGEKYSIRVGIIGDEAYEKHPHTDLTNAELGAIHEFGATINVTDKMRGYLHHIGIHLKPSTTNIVIPTRSFLRMPLLNGDFKNYLLAKIGIADIDDLGKDKEGKQLVRELNLNNAKKIPHIMLAVAIKVGVEALTQVQNAFVRGGWGKWAPISEITKKNRLNDPNSPPLQDGGDLMDCISVEIKGNDFYKKIYMRDS